jgi:hypothetical protein
MFLILIKCISLSLLPVTPNLEHMVSSKRIVSRQFINPKTVGRTHWTGDQPVAKPLPTQDNTNRIIAHRHPCIEWDWNPRSHCSSERR